nr:uncharacterized protein LOC104115416 [Nicotiana tomentosiformis]XP_033516980.1 uncharacterized protein LOC104115416 [Nicotiana tomentosiformis]XP_033516981.1 uncharacterized protein LOC104115416 [Nicotiana tomentosiformis]
MDQTQPPYPPPPYPTLYVTQNISDFPPRSWLEQDLTGQALLFRLIKYQQSGDHSSSSGLLIPSTSCIRRNETRHGCIWPVPLVDECPTSTHLTPYSENPFLPPPPLLGLIFTPWNNQHILAFPMDLMTTPPSPPSTLLYSPSLIIPSQPLPIELGTSALQQDLAATLLEMRETRTAHATLDNLRSFVLKEQYATKKIRLKCPPNLITCSLIIRPTQNPEIGKYAIVLIPTLQQATPPQLDTQLALVPRDTHSVPPDSPDTMSPTTPNMNFILWNYRGANNNDFHRQFRSLLDYHAPALIV